MIKSVIFLFQMASHRKHVCRRTEEVDLHLRQPGHRVALHQKDRQRAQDGILAISLFARNIGKICLEGANKFK